MIFLNKKYYQEDLSKDDDGKKWHLMLSSVIDKTNIFEFTAAIAKNKTEIKHKINEAEEQIKHLELTKNIIEIYPANFQYQRMFDWFYIIARLSLDIKLKKKVLSYKRFLDFVFKNEDNIFDPALYHNKTALLWTVTSESYVNILLTEKQRNLWIKEGFVLDKDNGITQPTKSSNLAI